MKSSGVDDFYGTYYWAMIVGYNYEFSRLLGYYCNYVDTIYSSVWKDWREYDKWHFYTIDGKDVRSEISHEQQCIAKDYLLYATKSYFKWKEYANILGVNNSFTQMQYNDYLSNVYLGIKHLGYSLHPIQDYYAHVRNVCFQFWKGRWAHLPGNVDDASQHTYAVLGSTASKTLEILLTFYNEYYILRI